MDNVSLKQVSRDPLQRPAMMLLETSGTKEVKLPNRSESKPELSKSPEPSDNKNGIDESALKKLVESMNRYMEELQYSLQFRVDKEAEQVIIRVLDGNGRLIRQIPPEQMSSLNSKMESGTGLLLNEILE